MLLEPLLSLDVLVELELLPGDSDFPADGDEVLEGLALAYRSLYQPPPLSWKEVWLINFSTVCSAHFGHTLMGSSEIFCHSSKRWPHAWHSYS